MTDRPARRPFQRIAVTVDDRLACALASDALARSITRPEAIRQAIEFDLTARASAAKAMAAAVHQHGEAARRLAQILAKPPGLPRASLTRKDSK